MTSVITQTTSASTTAVLNLRGGQLPKIDGKRMNETLHHSCQWGCTPDGGMSEWYILLQLQ
jgi:hypothetical protein